MECVYISKKTGREVRVIWREYSEANYDDQVEQVFGAKIKDWGEGWLSIEDGSEHGEIFILQ